MFCSNCGVKLPEKANKCPNCGESVTGNEYCGGFWGLVNGNKPQAPKATERINTENRNIQASKKDNKPSEREVGMMNNYKKNTGNILIVSAALAAVVIIEFIVILMFVLGSGNDGNIEMTDNSNIAATETDNGNNEFLQQEITQYTTAEEVTTEEYTEETTEEETNGIFQNDKKDEMDFMNET
ncbi:MAG: zinc-ribbon domain-containing protein [Candidatus Limousia pullorum]